MQTVGLKSPHLIYSDCQTTQPIASHSHSRSFNSSVARHTHTSCHIINQTEKATRKTSLFGSLLDHPSRQRNESDNPSPHLCSTFLPPFWFHHKPSDDTHFSFTSSWFTFSAGAIETNLTWFAFLHFSFSRFHFEPSTDTHRRVIESRTILYNMFSMITIF